LHSFVAAAGDSFQHLLSSGKQRRKIASHCFQSILFQSLGPSHAGMTILQGD